MSMEVAVGRTPQAFGVPAAAPLLELQVKTGPPGLDY